MKPEFHWQLAVKLNRDGDYQYLLLTNIMESKSVKSEYTWPC